MFQNKSFFLHFLVLTYLDLLIIGEQQGHCESTNGRIHSISSSSNTTDSSFLLRNHHLRPVSSLRQIHYVVQNAVIESISDLMIYWKRFRGFFLLDKYSGLKVSVLKQYLTDVNIDADVYMINSTVVIEDLIEYIATERSNIIVICNEFFTTKILNVAVQQHIFNRTVSWMIVGAIIPDSLLRIKIKLNSQVTLAVSLTTKTDSQFSSIVDEVHFLDVFFGYVTMKTEAVKFASWTVSKRLSVFDLLDRKDRIHGFYGRMTLGAVFEHAPFSIFFRDNNGHLLVEGYLLDLISMVLKSLNMLYAVKEVEPIYGILVNGSYTGYVGVLYRKEADFSFNVLSMLNSRMAAIRYVGITSRGYLGIAYNRPKPFMPPTAYILPFSLDVWILTIATCIILFAAIAVAWFTSRKYSDNTLDDGSNEQDMRSVFAEIVTGDFIVEVFNNARGLLTRIVYGTLLVTAILLFNYYTSVFTSFLTHRELDLPFVDLEGVVANPDYKVVLARDSRFEMMFAIATKGVYKEVWKKVMRTGGRDWFPTSFKEGYKVMATGKYAYLTEGPSTNYLAYDNCSVSFISKIYNREFYFMTARLDFPFSNLIRLGLIRTFEGGIVSRLARLYKLEGRPPCSTTSGSSTLGLDQVVGVFFVWGCGVLISLLALILEMTIKRKYTK